MSVEGSLFDSDSSGELSYADWEKGVRRRSRRLSALEGIWRRKEMQAEEVKREKEEEREQEEEDEDKLPALEKLVITEERPSPKKRTQGRGGERRVTGEGGEEAPLLGRSEMPPPEDPVELLCVIEHREPSALDDTPGREKLQNNCVIHLRAHIKNSEPAGYGCVKIRALKTMPVMLALSWSEAVEGQMGIWAKEDLGANSFFGPYEGKKPPYSTKTRKCSCCLKVEKTHLQSALPVDPSLPKYNWMRFVRGVQSGSEANLKPQIHQGQIFFAATRPIKKGTELLVNLNPGNKAFEVTRKWPSH
ncbi:uncharacterized protein [Penaeus vannamei]|uniref:uncharacterized protein isoform X2 n=1 Tax=Penaeus vannamei TaxID=6689 RepID=UPI00387F615F